MLAYLYFFVAGLCFVGGLLGQLIDPFLLRKMKNQWTSHKEDEPPIEVKVVVVPLIFVLACFAWPLVLLILSILFIAQYVEDMDLDDFPTISIKSKK